MSIKEDLIYHLSAHRGCSERLMARAREMTEENFELSSDPDDVLIRRMVRGVQAESHRMKGFVRLKALGERVLYGYIKPQHKIGDRICDHFARRSPGTIIVLGNSSQSWISLFAKGRTLRCQGASIDDVIKALQMAVDAGEATSDIEEVWNVYYDSQYCSERRNMQNFNHRMPKKALRSAGLSLEKSDNGRTLQDFFEV